MSNIWNYDTIKATARQMRNQGRTCRVSDLIALAPQNDPFYVGTPGERDKARWFAEIWIRFGYSRGVHLRRVHYQLVSQSEPVNKPDGTPYENTERDWEYLGIASKCARYLDWVDPAAFVDRRNPDPQLHADYLQTPRPDYWLNDPDWAGLDLPRFFADGYEGNLQPYHLEVWVEKTTMNDVLSPICRQYSTNLVTGAGEMSITAALDLVERVRVAARPCRIFYVSDFDPAGYGMPVSVARKVEKFIRERGLDLDIRLQPIALTRQQVIDYQLPRQPIKDSELRKGAFEDVHGAGAVELDAIEALHPGELGRIVEEAILTYHDPEIQERLEAQGQALQEALDAKRAGALEDLEPEISKLKARLQTLRQAVSKRLESVEIDLDQYSLPEPDLEVSEEKAVLFDSRRSYLDQLEYYHQHRNGES
jgi:hypothetical protein